MRNHNNGGDSIDGDVKPTVQGTAMFHDFLGAKTTVSSSNTTSEPISATSDLVSERQVGNLLGRVQLYVPRTDVSESVRNNQARGTKRSSSDACFSSRSSSDALNRAKMLQNGPRTNHVLQQPLINNKLSSFSHQEPSRTLKDTNSNAIVASQMAADEGSRTGIKGLGIPSSFNTNKDIARENLPAKMPCGNRLDSLTPPRQMTVFYGGQAHVFDDVHPNKADVIMALAGSNGGSWSTVFSHNPDVNKLPAEGSGAQIMTRPGVHPGSPSIGRGMGNLVKANRTGD